MMLETYPREVLRNIYILVLTGDNNMHVHVTLLIISGNVEFACSSRASCRHGDLFMFLTFKRYIRNDT